MDKKINNIGMKIRIERTKRRMSQEELAELANLSRPTIGAIERRRKFSLLVRHC